MPSNSIFSDFVRKGVFALVLVSVVSSGIPMVEVHSHENATYGHSHDMHDFFDAHGVEEADTDDGNADTTSLHAHNVNATSLSLIPSVRADIAIPRHSHSHIPPPYGWLPENVPVPLYRPPIA